MQKGLPARERKILTEMSGKAVGSQEGRGIAIASLSFDAETGELRSGMSVRRLEPRAACVLSALSSRAGRVIARQDLLDLCWGLEGGSDEALTQAVSQIRSALRELGESGRLVETLAKRGYRMTISEAVPLTPLQPTAGDRSPRAGFAWSVTVRVAAGLLVTALVLWISFAHAPRHFLRHALGLHAPTFEDARNPADR